MKKLLVVKYGSKTVADKPGVDQNRLNAYTEQLRNVSAGLIVVTSGAVMAGKAEAPEIEDDQVLAGIGSASIVMGWKKAFGRFGIYASQVLATDHEIDDPQEGDTLHGALLKNLSCGVVPIVNTNDQLSFEELEKRRWDGENDQLAAHIAVLMGAGAICLMTNSNGLFADGGNTISRITPSEQNEALALARQRGTGRQGIPTKVEAAITAANAGIDAYIAGAGEDIQKILAGQTGTHFVANV